MPIDWNFDPSVAVCDFFEELDLDDPLDVLLAAEKFIDCMETDLFRSWEAVIRTEQRLPTTAFLGELGGDLIAGMDSRRLCIDESPRFTEPWYEIVRKIVPRLLPEPLAPTSGPNLASLWPRMARAIDECSHGLSLPEGVNDPLDVVPRGIQHELCVQTCMSWLNDLGPTVESAPVPDSRRERFVRFLDELRGHRESIRFLELTLDDLLDRLALGEQDQRLLVELTCQRLQLGATNEPLAPRLDLLAASTPVERLPDELIKQAIVHPDPLVREMAVLYFANGYSPDPAVAPLAITAIQRYGWDAAFLQHAFWEQLVHSDESMTWMIDQLRSEQVMEGADPGSYLLYALAAADAATLYRHEGELDSIRRLSPGIFELIQDRIHIHRLSQEQAWRQFERAIGDPAEDYPGPLETKELLDLAQQLGDERVRNWVLSTLTRRVDDPGYSTWLEIAAAQMAGVLRLEPAVPYLISLLRTEDYELSHPAVQSLVAIGGEVVVDLLDRRYAAAGQIFRENATFVLESIHTAGSAATLLHWLDVVRDPELSARILQALLAGFVPSAMDRARQHLLGARELTWTQRCLRIQLVALCTLAGHQLPELEQWRKLAQEDFPRRPWLGDQDEDEQDGREKDQPPALPGRFTSLAASGPPVLPDSPLPDGPSRTIHDAARRVSRNDPCPCGSGKKYKKCCMRQTE